MNLKLGSIHSSCISLDSKYQSSNDLKFSFSFSPDPPSNVHTTQPSVYQADEDYVPPGSRGRGRGAKRTRTRTPNSRAKRQRVERNFAEENNSQPHTVTPQPANPQQVVCVTIEQEV